LEHDLDAVDAAVALVDERPVVGDAVGEGDAVRRISAGAVDQRRDELLVLRQGRLGDGGDADSGCRKGQSLAYHVFLLLIRRAAGGMNGSLRCCSMRCAAPPCALTPVSGPPPGAPDFSTDKARSSASPW